MAVDLSALRRAAEGDQSKKVAVSKAWLAEVHSELLELQMLRSRMDKLKRQVGQRDWDDGWAAFDKGIDNVFGKNGAFDKLFGKFRR